MIPDDPSRAEPGLEAGSLKDRHALVLGLGRYGGGLETTRFLVGEGAQVRVADSGSPEALAEPAQAVRDLGAEVVFGPQEPALLKGIDLVVASPAIPFEHPLLLEATRRGLPVTTETNFVVARVTAPVLGITGTKGKSTTTALVTSMLRATGRRVHQGGNIGRPLVAELDRIGPGDVVVLELSSFQLWWTRRIQRSPHVTLVTNLFPEHIDRHGTLEHYARAKRAALDFQSPRDVAVLPADDEAVRSAGWLDAGNARRLLWGRGGDIVLDGGDVVGSFGRASLQGLQLFGAHNRRNALAAAAAVSALLDQPVLAIERGARDTQPLPHRLQPVHDEGGVLFVDDSNSTHPEAAMAALRSFDRPIVLIAGGKDKGADRTALLDAIRKQTRAVVAIGTTGPELAAALGDHPVTVIPGSMAEAVEAARGLARPGDVVLLSPAFSSLDQYASYAVRGDAFREAAAASPKAC